MEFTNYRPVSLLSQFSKNLERIFHKRLMNFLDDKKKYCMIANMDLGKIDQHHWLY